MKRKTVSSHPPVPSNLSNITSNLTPKANHNESSTVMEEPDKSNGSLPTDVPTISLDRPFLWYLNDSEIGPIFFGSVENLLNLAFLENSTEADDNGDNIGTTMPPPSSPPGDEMNTNTDKTNGTSGSSSNNAEIVSDIEKFFLWSCRSFAPMSTGREHQKLPFEGAFEDEENTKSHLNIQSATAGTDRE